MSAKVAIQIVSGPGKGKTFSALTLPVTIGRDPENAVCLDDDRLSRFHVRIEAHGDQLLLRDMNSTNGTRVNGEPVAVRILKPGDQIGLGHCVLLYGSAEQFMATDPELAVTQPVGVPSEDGDLPSGDGGQPTTGPPGDAPTELDATGVWSDREGMGETLDLADPPSPAETKPDGLAGRRVDAEARRPTEPIAPMPLLSLAQSAQLIEVLAGMRRLLSDATGQVGAQDTGKVVGVPREVWHQILSVERDLTRRVAELEELARSQE